MTFGPLGDKDGDAGSLPQWNTLVSVVDGDSWCALSIEKADGTTLESEFASK